MMTKLGVDIDPNCEAWLLGTQPPGTTLQSITAMALMYNSVGHGVLTNSNPNLVTNAVTGMPNNMNLAIIINDNGAFFNSGVTTDNGLIAGNTAQAQIFILLHEYAHLLGAAGFKDDADSMDAGKKNNLLIQQKCATTIKDFGK